MVISKEQNFPNWYSIAAMVGGGALAEQGHLDAAMDQLNESVALARSVGTLIWRPYQLSLLAEVQIKSEQGEEAKRLVTESLEVAHETGELYWEAELHRLNGELSLSGPAGDPAEAEACFNQALEVARRQKAKSLELRAATSLSRLWQQQGRQSEAHDLLAPVYDWFTEGFDTVDLKEAKALLEDLS